MNIGVRHILPVYPFFILVASGGAWFWGQRHQIIRCGLIVLLAYHAVTAFRTAPDYLAFSNDFWGGTNNTHRFLDDSNVDWGQNFKFVKEYLAKENISDCWIAALGGGELVKSYQPCRTMPALDWDLTDQLVEPTPTVIEGTILISSWVLPPHGNPNYSPYVTDEYSVFLQAKPVEIIGGSIFVYRGRFEIPRVAALSYISRARRLNKMNRFDEAIAALRKSVELAPDKPHAHLELGISLAQAYQADEARRELETAVKLAGANPELSHTVEMRARDALQKLR
jgi:tetratricopeptide (TPR) repeat protein